MDARKLLIHLAVIHKGNWDRIFESIQHKVSYSDEEIEASISRVHCGVVTVVDKDYPDRFLHIYKPPFVLFYYGDFSLANSSRKLISVVGSRNCTSYGEDMTRKIVGELSPSFTIVSGMALGIDSIAQETAIEHGGKTIAVLGSGIDYVYPKTNLSLYNKIKENHLVFSEYPGDTEPQPENFKFRNRLVSALSKGTLVTQAFAPSGTMTTVCFALNQGRDVMCVPDRANSNSLCNDLIKEGASLVMSGKDVSEILHTSID